MVFFLNTNISWLLGGSCGLLVNGVEVVPNDIDLVVGPSDFEKTVEVLGKYMVNDREFKIGDVGGEINVFSFDKLKPIKRVLKNRV